jgi:hypothetical protein
MVEPVAAVHLAATALAATPRRIGAVLARATESTGADHTAIWMLVAAALVGFAAGWLVFEARRAWSPESLHTDLAPSLTSRETEALVQLMPKLVDHVGQLRREIAEVRAADLERSGRMPSAGPPGGVSVRELVTHEE